MKTAFYLLVSLLLVSCGDHKQGASGKVQIKDSALIARTSKTWSNGKTLIISFLDGDSKTKAEVEEFSKEWTKYANVDFVFYPTLNDIPDDKKADAVISFSKSGNNSTIGTDAGNKIYNQGYSVSLSNLDKQNINMRRSTILHEFGHVLGLEHEHQSINRKFKLNKEKALEYCKSIFNFTEDQCVSNIFETISGNDVYMSKYDPSSIMHYSLHPGFLEGNLNLRNNASLSLLDRVEIAKLYPGRMPESEIVSSYTSLMKEVDETKFYKNCKINESLVDQVRLNDSGIPQRLKVKEYSFSSIVPGEYEYNYLWEDKEGFLFLLKNDEYCNYDSSELATYRAKKNQERLQNQHFGNCTIPLDGNGMPKTNTGCGQDFPFQILDVDLKKSVDNSCYPSFEAALSSSKKAQYCNFSKSELDEFEKQKAQEFEASRTFGKCFVENDLAPKFKDPIMKCKDQFPWHIVKSDDGSPVTWLCYGQPNGAIAEMKNLPECRP